MDAVSIGTTDLPSLVDNGRMNVKLAGAYFKQTKLIRPNNNNVINIYIAYKIKPILDLVIILSKCINWWCKNN